MQQPLPLVLCFGFDSRELKRSFPHFHWFELDLAGAPPLEKLPELSDALGCICSDGAAHFYKWWAQHIAGPPPGVFDGEPADLGPWLMQALIADQAEMLAQCAGLSRQIGYLRQKNRDQAEELAHLRQQVDGHQKRFLFDITVQEHMMQNTGAIVTQLLPGEASGLAGLILPLVRGGTGRLVIRLIVAEEQAEVAQWRVDNPGDKALRLSLHAPLRQPRRTAQLQLEWQGESALEWGAAAMDDPLYGAQVDGVAQPLCLAMRGKNHGFGHGIAPQAPLQAMPVARDILSHAEGCGGSGTVQWMDMDQALMVHPVADAVSAAFLPAIAPPGLARIQVEVETLHMRSGPICYAIGIAPPDVTIGEDGMPKFAAGCQTAWQNIAARHRHALILTPPMLDRPHDLWLMTRLPKGTRNSAWGWATFSELSLWG